MYCTQSTHSHKIENKRIQIHYCNCRHFIVQIFIIMIIGDDERAVLYILIFGSYTEQRSDQQ